VTVNFDQKGSGAYGNAELRALYAFTNVGLQSVYNTYNIAKENKVRFGISIAAQTAAFLYLFPYINSLLARLRGDDDDEEWISELAKKSEYERNSNISFYTGKEGGFLKLPLSQEYRMFNGLAMDLLMWKNGKADAWTTAKNFTFGLLELIAYNPVLDAHRGSIADALPTVFVGAGQLITNSNFTGSPVYNPYADDAFPMYRQVRTNRKGEPYTPEPTIKALQWLNQAGGDETMPGWISKLKLGKVDLSNPDVVNHLMSYYLGAFYNPLVKQIENFGSEESNGKKIKNLLVPGAMYRSNDDSPNLDRYTENKYYELKKKSENADGQFKDYAKSIKEKGMDAFLVKMNKNPEVWKYAVIKHGVDAVESLEKDIKKQAGNAQLQKEQQIKADELKLKLIAFDKRMKEYSHPDLYSEEDLGEALTGIGDDLSEFLKE
jgi:hypothetical protein